MSLINSVYYQLKWFLLQIHRWLWADINLVHMKCQKCHNSGSQMSSIAKLIFIKFNFNAKYKVIIESTVEPVRNHQMNQLWIINQLTDALRFCCTNEFLKWH